MQQSPTSASDLDVLIVDDLRDVADSMAELLGLMGFNAAACYDAAEALTIVRARRPFCVLLDVNMPGMDGLDLTRAMRQECGDDVVLIAVSGAGPDDERAAATFDLVDHHFIKPLNIAELQRVLKK